MMKRPFACDHISVWLCVPVSKYTYLLSNVRGWAGWRMMLRRQSQKWSLSLGLLWRPGCFLWSTWEPEFDPAGRSCPWLPDLLCLETLDWWKQTQDKQISTLLQEGFGHWFKPDWEFKTSVFFVPMKWSAESILLLSQVLKSPQPVYFTV